MAILIGRNLAVVKVGVELKTRESDSDNKLPRAQVPPPCSATAPRLRLLDDRAKRLPF